MNEKHMTLDQRKLKELRELVDEVMYAPSKKYAQSLIRRLEFMASDMKDNIDSYASGKLSQVVSYAKEASGQVKNKEHWISVVEQSWYEFVNSMKNTGES